MRGRMLGRCLLVLAALAGALPYASIAEPPPWAPAHGWRKKQKGYYTGYTGTRWERDYGVIQGRCNRKAIGAVIGGVVGGVIGSQVGKGDGRTVATVLGTVIGAVIGAQIGKNADESDRACIGQALELANHRQAVVWTNPDTGLAYRLTPIRSYEEHGRPCRAYSLQVNAGGRREVTQGAACQAEPGVWELLPR